jgi:hypothetical protein
MANGLNSKNGLGANGEKRFASLLGNKFSKCDKKLGDGFFTNNDQKYVFEVKSTGGSVSSRAKLNQVRPIKCIILVTYFKKVNLWSVINPLQVIELTQTKTRGQHTECVIECTQIEVNKLPKDSFCTDENLIEKLIEVSKICETRKYKEVKHQCEVYLQALKSLNEESRQTLFSMVKSDI